IKCLPFAKFTKNKIAIANVVVRIPPPTELGDAPININQLINKSVAPLNSVISNVVKPPDRDETEWKSDTNILSCQLIPLKEFMDSKIKIMNAPNKSKAANVTVVIFVNNEKRNVFDFFLEK